MVSSGEECDTNSNGSVEWDVDLEIQLFYAMANNKPVGINKHFHMACIYEKLRNSTTKRITTADIWKHLGTLYDLSMLEETEPIPFPNDEVTFSLPENEFGDLMRKKRREIVFQEEEAGTSSSKDISSANPAKNRKESGSSYASTDTQSIKSEMDFDRRDSQDSNTSGTRDSSTSRKSTSRKEQTPKSKVASTGSSQEAHIEEDAGSRRGRRRANNSTPPAPSAAKRRRI